MGFLWSQFFVTPEYPTISFEGQTVIITGSNVGLGKEAARHIARLNASKIILAVRNTKAGEEARQDILKTTKRDPSVIEVWSIDLSSYASVKAFAERASSQLDRIDVLLENAAIAANTYATSEGHERTITVNVISTVYLALLMLPKLKEVAAKYNNEPRISIVSSEVHAYYNLPEWKEPNTFDALDAQGQAGMGKRYPTSKTVLMLALRAITPAFQGTGVVLNCHNPGLCHSELGRDAGWFFSLFKLLVARTTEVGSRTLVAGAAAGEESHGKYMTDGIVDERAVSSWIKSDEGQQAKKKVWGELKAILEKADPGVTKIVP